VRGAISGALKKKLRVPSYASSSAPYREGTEAPYLDPVAARQRLNDLPENGVDDVLRVTLIEVFLIADTPDEIRFEHQCPPHWARFAIKLR
jgi:hypothetical protein